MGKLIFYYPTSFRYLQEAKFVLDRFDEFCDKVFRTFVLVKA
jgi:hypothetical protein